MNTDRKLTQSVAGVALVTGLLLLIPLALQLTIGTGVDGQGFNWKLGDFIVIGILLFGTGLTYELLARKMKNTKHRVILAIVLVIAMLLIWADLAVGIFNIPGISGS